MKLYDQLEKYMQNKPSKFSESRTAADAINRIEAELCKADAIDHYTIIYLLIFHHYNTKEQNKKACRHPYDIDMIGKSKSIGPLKCNMIKIPPILQKIIVAYVGLYVLKERV